MSIVIDGTSGITPLAFSSNLQFTSTGQRITGDFSNSTISNRVLFQGSVLNGQTAIGAIPNGTSTQSQFIAFNGTDPANSAYIQILSSSTEARINSGKLGTGSDLPMTFYTSSAERMRIDTSGRVIVGTPYTTYNGPVAQFNGVNQLLFNTAGMVTIASTSTTTVDFGGSLGMSSYDSSLSAPYACATISGRRESSTPGTLSGYFAVATTAANGTVSEKMRIDSSGNLGLGVTPSAWYSIVKAVEIGSLGSGISVTASGASAGNTNITANAYLNSSAAYVYGISGYATRYRMGVDNGQHYWYTAPSGTAGNPITFTQAMTLDASGNLGVGTASPASYGKLAVIGGSIYTDRTISLNYGTAGAPSIDMWGSNNQTYGGATIYMRSASNGANYATAGTGLGTIFFGDTYTGGATVQGFAAENHSASALGSTLVFSTTANTTTTLTERLRIDSSGNVWQFVNGTTTSAYYKFGDASTAYAQVAGYYDSSTTGHLEFYTLNTTSGERMRITAEGNVGIGTGSPVNPGTGLYSALTINNTIGGAIYLQSSGSNVISLTGDSSGAWLYAIGASNSMILGSNGLERLRADPSGNILISTNTLYTYQPAPTSKAAAATLTGAELMTGILNTTGTTYTITLPTGTNIQSAVSSSMGTNNAFDWWVINTATGTITIGANGNTTLGSLTIATGVSAQFRFRRTGANLFTVYRIG